MHVLSCRLWRGAGLALPVFAARTRNSVGCGEFLDLLALVEFADASGMRLIQVRWWGTIDSQSDGQRVN